MIQVWEKKKDSLRKNLEEVWWKPQWPVLKNDERWLERRIKTKLLEGFHFQICVSWLDPWGRRWGHKFLFFKHFRLKILFHFFQTNLYPSFDELEFQYPYHSLKFQSSLLTKSRNNFKGWCHLVLRKFWKEKKKEKEYVSKNFIDKFNVPLLFNHNRFCSL